MSCENLPQVITDNLLAVSKDNNFTSSAQFDFVHNVTSEVSCSYRIRITENNRQLSLYVKVLQTESTDPIDAHLYFENEIIFYEKIIEHYKTIDPNLTFVARCLCTKRGSPSFIMMEDILSQGYRPFDVRESLSISKARLIAERLGQFHALSFLCKNRTEFVNATSHLKETIFRNDTAYRKIFISSIHDAFKLARQSFPSGSIYVERFAEFTLNVFDKMSTLIREDDGYRVVTHGDLWLNNVLYSEDAVKFIDFQGCRYASPVHDLMLFVLTALDKQTRESYDADLIRCYHVSLCVTLQKYGADPLRIFPFSALEKQLHRHTRFAFGLALVGLPLFLKEQTNSGRVESNRGQNDIDELSMFFEGLHANKSMKCKNRMLEILTYVVDRDYL